MAIKSWEQQREESGGAYERFLVYLKMDRAERSVRGAYSVYRAANGDPPLEQHGNAPANWYEDSRKWRWEERALVYDRDEDRKIMAALQRRRIKSLTEVADLGETLRRKAATAARMMSAVTQSVGTHEGHEVIVMASNLTPDQIARLAEVGVKIEQLALGNPTDRPELVGDADRPLVNVENAKDVLKRKLAEIRARRQEASGEGSGI
jgi:hypothetical protein